MLKILFNTVPKSTILLISQIGPCKNLCKLFSFTFQSNRHKTANLIIQTTTMTTGPISKRPLSPSMITKRFNWKNKPKLIIIRQRQGNLFLVRPIGEYFWAKILLEVMVQQQNMSLNLKKSRKLRDWTIKANKA